MGVLAGLYLTFQLDRIRRVSLELNRWYQEKQVM